MATRDTSIIGKRFGKLTVIDFDNEKKDRRTYLICQCDCGNTKSIRRCSLVYGTTKSCGCAKHEEIVSELVGKRFGRLVVMEYAYTNLNGDTYWLCECDCGESVNVSRYSLTTGRTRSCGCLKREMTSARASTHHMSNTRIYRIWRAIHDRCRNPNDANYYKYGARGIDVCNEWDDFITFYEWSMVNGYSDNLSIDRINNDDWYYPENCRWVDETIQANNRRTNRYITYCGNRHTLAEWSRILDIKYVTLKWHIDNNNVNDFAEYFGIIDPNWHEG